jgi:hypothetical protein
MTKERFIENLKNYLFSQIDNIAESNPLVAFTKPIIIKIIDNKVSSISNFLDLLKDSEGNLDVSGILSEMTTSIMDSKVFTLNIPIIGGITIGNGYIKFPIPYTEQLVVLNKQDIEELKLVLTTNT